MTNNGYGEQVDEVRYCSACGKENTLNDRFCGNCATPFAQQPQPDQRNQGQVAIKSTNDRNAGIVGMAGIAIAVVVGIVMWFAFAGGNASPSASSTVSGDTSQTATLAPVETPTDVPVATPADSVAPGTMLVDYGATGQWTSPKFTGPADWVIDYTYDCSNFGQAGNFQVYIQGALSTSGINELQTSGSGTTNVHDASGPGVYLMVNSECDWTVKAHN